LTDSQKQNTIKESGFKEGRGGVMDTQKQNESKVITIYDIAKEAGVSAATVSRVLTNSANVRPEKKERIHRLIEKYNFKPNALARGLSDTRSKVIGIIVADVRNPFYADLFVACEVAARKAGYTVLLFNSLGETQQEEKLLEKLQEQRVDVIIQVGGRVDDLQSNEEYVEKVKHLMNTIPMVVTGKLDGTDCCQVRIDATKSTELLMEHLIGLNHTRIALIGGSMSVQSTYEKCQCYKQMLAKYNIPFRPELIAQDGFYNFENGYDRMNKMIAHKPSAVIAINDFTAAGIMRSITEHGLRIPQDISLVSYDNTFISNVLAPKLTSIDYNYEAFGKKLVKAALGMAAGKEISRMQMVTPSLIIRESSGPAVNP